MTQQSLSKAAAAGLAEVRGGHRPSPSGGASPTHVPSAWRLLLSLVHVLHLKERVRPSSGQTREGFAALTKL